jgi:hypothetical protein
MIIAPKTYRFAGERRQTQSGEARLFPRICEQLLETKIYTKPPELEGHPQ